MPNDPLEDMGESAWQAIPGVVFSDPPTRIELEALKLYKSAKVDDALRATEKK